MPEITTRAKMKQEKGAFSKVEVIIERYEQSLEENPTEIIVLDPKDMQTVNQYLNKHDDPELGERFEKACATTLQRVNEKSQSAVQEECYYMYAVPVMSNVFVCLKVHLLRVGIL